MHNNLLEVKNLTVRYESKLETVCAVNGISFAIRPKETIGLVGETGAGKTTTALSIMRLLPEKTGRIATGEILFEGRNLLELPEAEMRRVRGADVSMIFQDPMTSLNPVLTIGDQIKESLVIHNYDNKTNQQLDARVDELLTLVGVLPGRKGDYPHQFSGGMKQRVVIAISLACQPKLIIADEPTTALDVTIQAQVLAMMADLKKKLGTSMIMITHDLGIIAQTCDYVGIMYAGEIIEQGPVADIFEGERHHPYTVGLFGSIPDLELESDRLSPVPGLMPDPTRLPSGCKFHPRCSRRREICLRESPLPSIRGEHSVSCHLYTGEGN